MIKAGFIPAFVFVEINKWLKKLGLYQSHLIRRNRLI